MVFLRIRVEALEPPRRALSLAASGPRQDPSLEGYDRKFARMHEDVAQRRASPRSLRLRPCTASSGPFSWERGRCVSGWTLPLDGRVQFCLRPASAGRPSRSYAACVRVSRRSYDGVAVPSRALSPPRSLSRDARPLSRSRSGMRGGVCPQPRPRPHPLPPPPSLPARGPPPAAVVL